MENLVRAFLSYHRCMKGRMIFIRYVLRHENANCLVMSLVLLRRDRSGKSTPVYRIGQDCIHTAVSHPRGPLLWACSVVMHDLGHQ